MSPTFRDARTRLVCRAMTVLRAAGSAVGIAVLASAISSSPLWAQRGGVILGTVWDDSTGSPLVGAEVQVVATNLRAVTRADGSFVIAEVPFGPQALFVRRLGYHARFISIESLRDSASIAVTLAPLAQSLAPVVVTGEEVVVRLERSGFYWRKKTGTAPQNNFITRLDIEREAPLRLSDLLRKRGLAVNGCGVFLDGAYVADLRSVLGRGAGARTSATGIDWLSPASVEGLEVYTRASQVPAAYNVTGRPGARAGCVVLVWSR